MITVRKEDERHPGYCCESCYDDKIHGYGDDIQGCCCRQGIFEANKTEPRLQDETKTGEVTE